MYYILYDYTYVHVYIYIYALLRGPSLGSLSSLRLWKCTGATVMCIYIYIYIHTHTYIYMCIYIYIHTYQYKYVYTYKMTERMSCSGYPHHADTWRGLDCMCSWSDSGILYGNLREYSGENGFPRKPTGSLFCSYRNLRKSPEASGSLRENVI